MSKRLPARGLTSSDENSPIQRNPEMILSLSETLGKLQIPLMRVVKVLEEKKKVFIKGKIVHKKKKKKRRTSRLRHWCQERSA